MTEAKGDPGFSGKVTNVFKPIGCIAIEVQEGTLRKGDVLLFFKEHHLDPEGRLGEYRFQQRIESIEIDHQQVSKVTAGKRCGVKINVSLNGLPPNNARVIRLATVQQMVSKEARRPYFVG